MARALLWTCWLCAAAMAQGQPADRVTVMSYDEAGSRALFQSCDRDADDRLDLFEASRAIETLDSPRNRDAFRRLDRDRDGFVDWPEFDRFYRASIQAGDPLHLRPFRKPATPAARSATMAGTASPQRRLLDLFDRDRDGALDASEQTRMLQELALPAAVARQLAALDQDRDGRIDERELTPIAPLLRVLPGRVPASPTTDPDSPWAAADRDGDGRIDASEFALVLRRIDPCLPRWTPRLMEAIDRDQDGALHPAELAPPTAEQQSPRMGALAPPRAR